MSNKFSTRWSLTIVLTIFSAHSTAFLIDDFRPVNYSNNITIQGPIPETSYVGVQTGAMLTGERDVEIRATRRNEAPSQYHAGYAMYQGIGEYYRVGGVGFGGAWQAEDCEISLQYDGFGDEGGNVGFGNRLTAASAGHPLLPPAVGGIRVWILSIGNFGAFGKVTLREDGQVLGEVEREMYNGNLHFVPISFPFGEDILARADSITLSISVSQFYQGEKSVLISHIDTIVPEPLGLIPIGAGFAWLLVRRRRVGGR